MWKAVIRLRDQSQHFLQLRKHDCSKGNISFWFNVNDGLIMHIQSSSQDDGVGKPEDTSPGVHIKIITV